MEVADTPSEIKDSLELSVIMPCRNEQNTVGYCVDDALSFIKSSNISGEVIVVDNCSEDNSAEIAKQHGARVVFEQNVGYGSAIRAGISKARGKVVIIGDCDTTYDFLNLYDMYSPLADGSCDMVIGNRYDGGIERGGMSLSHKLGVRFLSFCARVRFKTDVYDFHCGLRGATKVALDKLTLETDGMEFATEMIAKAVQKDLKIQQLPIPLKKCIYNRKSKLRTLRDGFRHLRYILKNGGNL